MSEAELYRFAKWVAKEVCRDDFADNADAFAEVACRKLKHLGLVGTDGALWIFADLDTIIDSYSEAEEGE